MYARLMRNTCFLRSEGLEGLVHVEASGGGISDTFDGGLGPVKFVPLVLPLQRQGSRVTDKWRFRARRAKTIEACRPHHEQEGLPPGVRLILRIAVNFIPR